MSWVKVPKCEKVMSVSNEMCRINVISLCVAYFSNQQDDPELTKLAPSLVEIGILLSKSLQRWTSRIVFYRKSFVVTAGSVNYISCYSCMQISSQLQQAEAAFIYTATRYCLILNPSFFFFRMLWICCYRTKAAVTKYWRNQWTQPVPERTMHPITKCHTCLPHTWHHTE